MTAGAMFEFGPTPIQFILSSCLHPLTDQHHPNAMSYPNQEQAAVLSHLDGTLLVLAPAGTGKTRIMADRLARNQGVWESRPHSSTFDLRPSTFRPSTFRLFLFNSTPITNNP